MRSFDHDMKIISARLRTCGRDLGAIVVESFASGRPADRILAGHLRESRKRGSSDRRLLGESLFSVFRWWGFIRKIWDDARKLESANSAEAGSSGRSAGPDEVLIHRIIFFALMMDSFQDDVVLSFLADKSGFPKGRLEGTRAFGDPVRRASEIARLLGVGDVRFSTNDLVPEWCLPLLPPGIDTHELVRWQQRRPPMWLRLRIPEAEKQIADEIGSLGMRASRHPRIGVALRLDNPRINLYSLETFRGGLFEVQDLASQMIGLSCAPRPGERWWDACAGAGGKSLQLASIMEGKGTVVASDIREYKLDDLRKRARRADLHNIRCEAWDGSPLKKSKQGSFDGVLVDAPCSCSGTWRRNPDARWTGSASEIPEMAMLQLKILSAAASGVRKGGVLVYATCSLFVPENEAVVDKFMESCPEFRLEPFGNPQTGEKTDGLLRIYPWDGDCDSIFAARFRRG